MSKTHLTVEPVLNHWIEEAKRSLRRHGHVGPLLIVTVAVEDSIETDIQVQLGGPDKHQYRPFAWLAGREVRADTGDQPLVRIISIFDTWVDGRRGEALMARLKRYDGSPMIDLLVRYERGPSGILFDPPLESQFRRLEGGCGDWIEDFVRGWRGESFSR